MLVQVKKLQYWKTEHQDMERCQDACELAPERGLFAVADGAGTTLFPAIWARILARHFVDIPLTSDNPFEVEWWVRLAQEQYKLKAPNAGQLIDWSVRNKAQNQGSDSTLATMRISAVYPSSAQAELLVFGDSCVIIGNTVTNEIEKSFVLQEADEFNLAPICVPSTLKFFNRYFNRCSLDSITLQPHHIVILATDAVSKWILSGGSGGTRHAERWDAFQKVYRTSEEEWPDFIEGCRKRKEMVDDDSTALILTFNGDEHSNGIPLAPTTDHSHPMVRDDKTIDIVQQRKEAFQKAQKDENNELVAIYYGDGKDLKSIVNITDEQIQHARAVADALREVLQAFRQAQNSPGLVAKVEPIWRQHAYLLQKEKCADNIRATLQSNGINLALPGQQVSPPEPAPSNVIPPSIGLPAKSTPSSSSARPMGPSSDALKLELEKKDLELEKKDLRLRFLEAFVGDNDDNLLAAVEAIENARSRHSELISFTPNQEIRIKQARERKQVREKLQQAFQSGLVVEIANVCYAGLEIQNLNPDEQNKVELARQLAEAFSNEDDSQLLTIYQRIQHQRIFTFTDAEQKHIELAWQRLQVFEKFKVALDSGRLSAIVKVYDPILDGSPRLTPQERELLAFAQEFVLAYRFNDDDALMHAYEKLKGTSYGDSIVLSDEERKRIEYAEKSMQTVRLAAVNIVATVMGQKITLEDLRKVCRIKEPYIYYQMRQWQQPLNKMTNPDFKQKVEERIAELKAGIDPQHLPTLALDDIINDVIIQAKIAEDKLHGIPLHDFDTDRLLPTRLEEFKQQAEPDYETILRIHRLTEDDVRSVLSLLLRRELFVTHFQNQQEQEQRHWYLLRRGPKPMLLQEWLDKQRKEAGVTYEQYSEDPDKRGTWLLGLLRLLK